MRLAPVILICLTAAACGGSVSSHARAGEATRSRPDRPGRPDLVASLVTPAQLRAIAGPFARVSLALDRPNPDPRAPCGVPLTLPALRPGEAEQLENRAETFIEWVGVLPPGRAAAFVDAQTRDEHPGCPAYRSATPYGYRQLNRYLGAVALPGIADDRAEATLRIHAGGRRPGTVYAAQITLSLGDLLGIVGLADRVRPSVKVIRAIAAQAAADLRRAAPAGSGA